jgi:hypothetical protein
MTGESEAEPEQGGDEEPQPPAHPLLGPAHPAQIRLLEAIARGSERSGGGWPCFQYVDSALYRDDGLDAAEVMLTCPRVMNYSWFRAEFGTVSPRSEEWIALTVTGLNQLPRYRAQVELLLRALACMVAAERSVGLSPVEFQQPTLTSGQLITDLQRRFKADPPPGTREFILDLIEHEPATWGCGVQRLESRWELTLTPVLRLYAGVTTVEQYVDHLVDHLSPAAPPAVFRPSGLALPEAVDYLNLAWRMFTTLPLFRIPRAEGAAKLASECRGSDEFDALLSALCSILGRVELPGHGGTSLKDLEAYLKERLDVDAAGRACEAVKDLRALFALRAWRQHAGGADDRGHGGMRRLGLQLPASDWATAWATVQGRSVAALNALREEVEDALPTA